MGLDARNAEAVKVFFAVRDQYVTVGPVGYPVAVRVEAVIAALDLFEVTERERVFLRVTQAINGHFLTKVQARFKK